MDWLNYHHLFYFHMIHQERGLLPAAKRLRLSHSTLSKQLRELEAELGGELFERRGKRLLPTPLGDEVATYAAEIFHIGHELVEMAHARAVGRRAGLRVGVVSAIPKSVTFQLLRPALGSAALQCRQDRLETLIEELTTNQLHLVLSDTPYVAATGQRVLSQLLGRTNVFLYGTSVLAARYSRHFPRSLANAPVLMPGRGTSLRQRLDRYFAEQGIAPHIQAELDDSGLVRVFGQHGIGMFPVREALQAEVEDMHRVVPVGQLEGVEERYYALMVERKIRHEGVQQVISGARLELAKPRGASARKRTRRRH